jgi:hypothetical protein
MALMTTERPADSSRDELLETLNQRELDPARLD